MVLGRNIRSAVVDIRLNQKGFENIFHYSVYIIILILDVRNTVHYNKSTEKRTFYNGGAIMLAVNYTNLRDNMKTYMDKVTDDYETMIVTRKNNKNVVMLSEETYNNLMENVYIMGNKANYDWLMESKAQLEKGKFSTHNLTEVTVDE